MNLNKIKDIREFVLRERNLSVSDREWKFRLRGYGYGIRDSAEGLMIVALRGNRALCPLCSAV
ncbi:MAG: hypothetical protein AAGA28_00610 [Pseudomonadota bacterium]